MKNLDLTNKTVYKMKNEQVETLVVTVSPVSPTIPPVATAYIFNHKLYVNFAMQLDGDIVSVKPPYDMKITDAKVQCTGSIANGGVIVKKETSGGSNAIMIAELACITTEAIVRATTISPTLQSLTTDDTIKIVGVSSDTEGIIVFDIQPPN